MPVDKSREEGLSMEVVAGCLRVGEGGGDFRGRRGADEDDAVVADEQ